MKINSFTASLFTSLTTLLAVCSAPLRAEDIRGEILSKYPILRGDPVVESAQAEYDAACAAARAEENEKIAALPKVEWTDEDADAFWNRIAESATLTSTAPRLADADAQTGEGVLETFGTRYMPNAYAAYQDVRSTAKEREQLLAENFPDGRASDTTGGGLYDKVSKACAKAVSEMFRRHDELCHFHLLHRVGVVTDAELSTLDAKPIRMVLPAAKELPPPYTETHEMPSRAERDFLEKYLPESWKAYQALETDFTEGKAAYAELRKTAILLDAARAEPVLRSLPNRLSNLRGKMAAIIQTAKELKLLHAVGETTATQLAEKDRSRQNAARGDILPVASLMVRTAVDSAMEDAKAPQMAEKQRAHDYRVDSIRSMARQKNASTKSAIFGKCARVAGEREAALLLASMVPIPGKDYRMGKYEVTQSQWEAIMGENPSHFKGADNPVENVSWDDCQEFLEKLNALPAVKESGLVFRLPTDAEWEYACRAGATGKYCKLANGTEITEDTLGQVAWFDVNSDKKTHPVGQKQPNAFGLHDMHGNVWEWCQEEYGEVASWAKGEDYEHDRVRRGGSWNRSAWDCESSDQYSDSPSFRHYNLGFRLCADKR